MTKRNNRTGRYRKQPKYYRKRKQRNITEIQANTPKIHKYTKARGGPVSLKYDVRMTY
jgi:hypothetical protein